jgi:hypothetical protein
MRMLGRPTSFSADSIAAPATITVAADHVRTMADGSVKLDANHEIVSP